MSRLRRASLKKAMTQQDLADATGVERATIVRLEGGKQRARPSTARKLAEALGVEPGDLMGDDDQGPPMAADREGER